MGQHKGVPAPDHIPCTCPDYPRNIGRRGYRQREALRGDMANASPKQLASLRRVLSTMLAQARARR